MKIIVAFLVHVCNLVGAMPSINYHKMSSNYGRQNFDATINGQRVTLETFEINGKGYLQSYSPQNWIFEWEECNQQTKSEIR